METNMNSSKIINILVNLEVEVESICISRKHKAHYMRQHKRGEVPVRRKKGFCPACVVAWMLVARVSVGCGVWLAKTSNFQIPKSNKRQFLTCLLEEPDQQKTNDKKQKRRDV